MKIDLNDEEVALIIEGLEYVYLGPKDEESDKGKSEKADALIDKIQDLDD